MNIRYPIYEGVYRILTLERTPVFQAETSASGLKQLNDRILQPERPSTRGLRSG